MGAWVRIVSGHVLARRHQVLVILVAAERAGYFTPCPTNHAAVGAAVELLGKEFSDVDIQAELIFGYGVNPFKRPAAWRFYVDGNNLEDFDGIDE